MALLVGIVEREVRYLQTLLDTTETSDLSFASYVEIATEMGIYGDAHFRLKVVQHYLQDLYHYFCHLYNRTPDPDLAQPVEVVPLLLAAASSGDSPGIGSVSSTRRSTFPRPMPATSSTPSSRRNTPPNERGPSVSEYVTSRSWPKLWTLLTTTRG